MPQNKPQGILFSLALLIFISTNIFAQDRTITGQITAAGSSRPIIAATVLFDNSRLKTTTDTSGAFKITGLKHSKYHLIINAAGFAEFEEDVYLNDENQEIKIALKPSSINLSEVKVNPGKSITQSQSISGIDQILRPVNTAQDLLRLVPGLFIAQHAGGGKAEQIFLRGFDCDHGTDFNIVIDGLPVNMVSHAHGQGYADFHFVIPETVGRLKVFKGPYTARFGDFATAGTGEFSTKNSIENNEIKVEAGMFDTRAMTMFKLLDKKHLFSKETENAYIAGEYVFTNSYFDKKQNFSRYNLFGKYSGMLDTNNFLSFSASTFSSIWDASGQVPQRAVDAGIIDRFGSIDPSEGGKTNRSNINAILTTTTENSTVIKNQIYYINYYFDLFSDFSFFLNDPIHGDEINQTDRRNIFGYNGSFQKEYAIADKILHTTFGVGSRNDLTHISLRHAQNRSILDTIVSGKVYQQNTSAYLDLTFDINPQFSINMGSRLDYFEFRFKDDNLNSLTQAKSIVRLSPKLNFFYAINDNVQLFLKSGIGFHSNDARSVVINHAGNSLPKAYGEEIGSEFKLSKRVLINVALWEMYLQSELVYVGDEGTAETNFPTQRVGTDLSIRYQITNKLCADIDFNYNHGRLVGPPEGENYIPLAPRLTSVAGLTYKQDKGLNASLRYRFIDSRPANENNSVTAKGYFLIDAVLSYKLSKFEFGLTAENLLNTKWNQAQFNTESRLFNESAPVSELNFTPGTPFFLKANIAFRF